MSQLLWLVAGVAAVLVVIVLAAIVLVVIAQAAIALAAFAQAAIGRRRSRGTRLHDPKVIYTKTGEEQGTVTYPRLLRPNCEYLVVHDRGSDGRPVVMATRVPSRRPDDAGSVTGSEASPGTTMWDHPEAGPARIHVVAATGPETVAMLRAALANERAAVRGIEPPTVRVGDRFRGAAKGLSVVLAIDELSPGTPFRVRIGYRSASGEPERPVAVELLGGYKTIVLVGVIEDGVAAAVAGPRAARLEGLPGKPSLAAALRVALALLDERYP